MGAKEKLKKLAEDAARSSAKTDVIIARISSVDPFVFIDVSDSKIILNENLVAIPDRFKNIEEVRKASISGGGGHISWTEKLSTVTHSIVSFALSQATITFKDNQNKLGKGDIVVLISYNNYNKYVLMDRLEKAEGDEN